MTLLLNATYEPLRVLNWKRAITLLWQGKVEVLEVYDQEIRGVSITIKLPSVLRLLRVVKVKNWHRAVKFSRANIFLRDRYSCQYCKKRFRTEDLTFDHVVPIARGGKKTWENIVTACIRCNNKKSGRTPVEARMKLIKKPEKPNWQPSLTITIGIKNAPESWRDYLYWNLELDNDSDPDTS
ncbi:MAG TPA: HNH endonuclease [Nitrospiria bacterium]|jgi:5-methylcytosine-specific restriction endonuclease McrA